MENRCTWGSDGAVERKAVLLQQNTQKPRRPADKNVPPPSLLWPPLFVRFSPHEPVVYPFQPPPQCSSPQNRQWSHLSLPPLSSSVLFPPSRFLCRFLDRSGDVSVQPGTRGTFRGTSQDSPLCEKGVFAFFKSSLFASREDLHNYTRTVSVSLGCKPCVHSAVEP